MGLPAGRARRSSDDLTPRRSRRVARAFGFPDWCGHNWNAFNACFGDYVEENDGAHIAVVWRNLEAASRQVPATTAEVGWALLECASGAIPTLAPGTGWSVTLNVFAIGDGTDFCHPG